MITGSGYVHVCLPIGTIVNKSMFGGEVLIQSTSCANWCVPGGILSPYSFRFYVCDIIDVITSMRIGCNVNGQMINLLCFADDTMLLSPSWVGLQMLIDKLHALAVGINMTCNVNKTVCMGLTH